MKHLILLFAASIVSLFSTENSTDVTENDLSILRTDTITLFDALNSCSITLQTQQHDGPDCNGECDTDPCGLFTITVLGIYGCSGFYTPQDGIDINGGYECGGGGSGTWNSTPSYTTDVDICQFSIDSGKKGCNLRIPITLNYTYDCGGYTCTGGATGIMPACVC